MKILTVDNITNLVLRHGVEEFFCDLIKVLREDFGRFDTFTNIPRPSMHVPGGVLEVMPICDNKEYYSFKYVNCHPKNTLLGLQTVVATGQLSRIDTGYPVMISEMTLLTAFRTAATSALATDYVARKDSNVVAIIGTGAQSEFQILAQALVRDIKEVRFFDIDSKAMDKFEKNMNDESFRLVRCKSAEGAVGGADIITVCTATKANVAVLKNEWITPGMHVNAIGGDTVGKTELDEEILNRSKIVVEYFEQSYIEGEIQRLSEREARGLVQAELSELIDGKRVRKNTTDITLFDSVGIALEDYSVLRLVYNLSEKYDIGEDLEMIPVINNPKDLYSMIT